MVPFVTRGCICRPASLDGRCGVLYPVFEGSVGSRWEGGWLRLLVLAGRKKVALVRLGLALDCRSAPLGEDWNVYRWVGLPFILG